ncbi:NapC/NirT family cytochrome c [Candidatus Desantisbacteria bacterium]|nr:NapC/NirT family cytochrome c [Candidatus Desantisbacteria bacterium]
MIEWIKKNLVLTIVIVIVAGTVAFVAGIKLADKPFFCGMLCHEMQPHVDSLKANFHGAKDVICMDCHSEQGFINHATEHLAALSLLGGHFSKSYLEDEFGFHKNVQGFNAEEMNFKGKTDTEEEKKLLGKCAECHPNRMGTSYYMKVPEHKKEMITENCIRCHEEVEAQKQEGEPAKIYG